MKEVFRPPYAYWLVCIFVIYIALNIFMSKFYVTMFYIPIYFDTLNWPALIISIVLSSSIAFLVALTAVYAWIKYKRNQYAAKDGAIVCAGAFGGFATGICAACMSGTVPLIFSLIGITFSFASLPFKGVEIQLLILVLLLFNLRFLK